MECKVNYCREKPRSDEHPKAHELNSRSIEILESIGVSIQQLEQEASPISDGSRIAFCTTIKDEFGEINIDKDVDDPSKYKRYVKNERPYLNISQSEIEKVLRKTIKENPNIDFLSGHTWQSVEDIGDTLIAKVEDINNDKNIIIDAKYLLGADGANSPVRKTLEIQMLGHGIIGTFVNAYFENNLRSFIKKPAKLYWIVNPAAAGVFIAHHIDKRWVYNFPIYEPWDNKEEITDEYQITTVINSHDMNSVMEIGEKIIFLKDGLKAWEGSKDNIFKTDNEVVTNFVYSSNLFKKVRKMYIEENK